MEKYTHKCINEDCNNTYTDEDPDAYFCAPCQNVRKAIAKKVDKQFAGRSTTPPKSAMQEYEENSVVVNGMKLMKVHL